MQLKLQCEWDTGVFGRLKHKNVIITALVIGATEEKVLVVRVSRLESLPYMACETTMNQDGFRLGVGENGRMSVVNVEKRKDRMIHDKSSGSG